MLLTCGAERCASRAETASGPPALSYGTIRAPTYIRQITPICGSCLRRHKYPFPTALGRDPYLVPSILLCFAESG